MCKGGRVNIKNFFNIKWLLVAVIFTAIVIFLTHIPEEAIPSRLQVSGLDKLAHVLAYGVITFLFILSLRTFPTVLAALLLFFAILAVGTLDELTQPFFNRTASLMDLLANIVGIITVLLSFLCFTSSKRQASPSVNIWKPKRPTANRLRLKRKTGITRLFGAFTKFRRNPPYPQRYRLGRANGWLSFFYYIGIVKLIAWCSNIDTPLLSLASPALAFLAFLLSSLCVFWSFSRMPSPFPTNFLSHMPQLLLVLMGLSKLK